MSIGKFRSIAREPRYWQIAALSALTLYCFVALDFGAAPAQSGIAIGFALATQLACAGLTRRRFDWRSAMITGLSLGLLLRTGDYSVMALAAVLSILSKFLIRVDGGHLFNPAAFGISAALLSTHAAWVSPGQWGASAWLAALVILLGGAVLTRAPRLDTALAFLAAHAFLLLARATWLGDPIAIPLHQMMTGSLLVFAFFMITDPRTTPESRAGRVMFAVGVAAMAHYLAFFGQVRPALYFSLLLAAPLTPVLNRVLPRARSGWNAAPILVPEKT
jgi:Na+-transporting NADH:ubiquinone oxidoreductase subunit NqrB